jgi:hypothetical protein
MASVVINGHKQHLPPGTIHRVTPVAGNSVGRPLNTPELLGVDVQHLPGFFMLVAHDRLGRLQIAQPERPARASTRETVLLATPSAAAIRACVSRLWRNSTMASALAAEIALGDSAGRLEASVSPSQPIAR